MTKKQPEGDFLRVAVSFKESCYFMKFLSLPKEARFSNKYIFLFLLPVIFEQLMVAGLTMADTFMVSKLGETAVAGVALVSRIDNFAKQFFVALAQGGTVVLAQYIGAEDMENAKKSLRDNLRIVVGIGLLIMAVMVFFKNGVLNLLFGGAEKDVLGYSSTYFTYTALSYPFVALYYGVSATFRAMGESKIPFYSSIAMMLFNLALKYIFIFHLNMGVMGAAFSTLIAMATVGIVLLFMLYGHHNKVRLSGFFKFNFDGKMAGRILKVSVPNGIEQGMFQLGALLIAGLVSGLGAASIAADHYARTISPLMHCIGGAFNAVTIVIIGQCMGAGKPDEAKFYVKHILKIDYIMTTAAVVLCLIFVKPLIALFDGTAEAQKLAFQILLLYGICSCFFYPTSFALASALRGTGDTKFVMVIATLSMFLFRIGAAYIFVHVFNMGVLGTWVAMVSDWLLRTVIFLVRYAKGKWQQNKVI